MADARLYERLTLLAEEEFDIPKERFLRNAVLEDEPLSFDELMKVELMFTIEEEFRETGLAFNDEDFRKCVTFGDVADLTERMLQGKETEVALAMERQVEERKEYGEDVGKFGKTEKPKEAPKRQQKPRKTVERKEEPIRKHQQPKAARGRHGRHSRRDNGKDDSEKRGDEAVRGNGRSRPRVGREDGKGSSEVATPVNERHEVADGEEASRQ